MSRKFNTKKFIKDVLNDRYALVIGNEIIFDTKIEPTGDAYQYFLLKVNDNSNVQYGSCHEIDIVNFFFTKTRLSIGDYMTEIRNMDSQRVTIMYDVDYLLA